MTSRLDAALAELAAAIREELAAASVTAGPDRLLDVSAAAAELGIGRTAAYAEIAAGRLRSLRIGRRRLVPQSAIGDYIAQARAF